MFFEVDGIKENNDGGATVHFASIDWVGGAFVTFASDGSVQACTFSDAWEHYNAFVEAARDALDAIKVITPKQAKDLAIAYSAYIEASDNKDENGRRVWGRILRKAQRVTGVELLDLSWIKE